MGAIKAVLHFDCMPKPSCSLSYHLLEGACTTLASPDAFPGLNAHPQTNTPGPGHKQPLGNCNPETCLAVLWLAHTQQGAVVAVWWMLVLPQSLLCCCPCELGSSRCRMLSLYQ
jgi:hypothetical protein